MSSRTASSGPVIAINENRLKEIGTAVFDISHPVFHLSQFCDTATYMNTITKIYMENPIEVILPSPALHSQLHSFIKSQFPSLKVTFVDRSFFSETKGSVFLQEYVCDEDQAIVTVLLSKQYLCLASAYALYQAYHINSSLEILPKGLKVKYSTCDGCLMIDIQTVFSLELIRFKHTNSHTSNSPRAIQSVLDFIDDTKTPQGKRFLRSNILQPPSEISTIQLRQESVREFLSSEKLFFGVSGALSNFADYENLLSLLFQVQTKKTKKKINEAKYLSYNKSLISYIIKLKKCLDSIEPLIKILNLAKSTLLKKITENLSSPKVFQLFNIISGIAEDSSILAPSKYHFEGFNLIKSNENGLLDAARTVYNERIEDVEKLFNSYQKEYPQIFDNAKLMFSKKRIFYFSIQTSKGESIPDEFKILQANNKTTQIISENLMALNNRIRESMAEVLILISQVLNSWKSGLIEHLSPLYKISESIALLDMLQSLSSYVTLCPVPCVCPEFTENGPLALSNAHNPLLLARGGEKDGSIPSNTYSSRDSQYLHIITGQNNSGKTTYITGVAILTIMAHLGGFLPAKFASFPIFKRVAVRLYNNSSPIEGSLMGTFYQEMKDLSYLVHDVSRQSLVIFDELGRSTSPEDGSAIMFAVVEYFLNIKCFGFLSTHFLNAANSIQETYGCVLVHKMAVSETSNGRKFTYSLREGCEKDSGYGIELASLSGWPPHIIEEAKNVRGYILMRNQERDQSFLKGKIGLMRIKQMTIDKLKMLRNSTLDEKEIRDYIHKLILNYNEMKSKIIQNESEE